MSEKLIKLNDSESVTRNGKNYSIGDKVYGEEKAPFGVGVIREIEVMGVHFGFRALISGSMLDEPCWVDSRNLNKQPPDWTQQ